VNRVEVIGDATLYLGDCRDVLPMLGRVDAVVTDPPYPNNAGHFVENIPAAHWCFANIESSHWLVFWTEMERPPVRAPHVATHIWHRSNTNRPDNYEPIFEYHTDGKKRASRVMSHYVVFPGLTGIEASGHPTEKNVNLIAELVTRTRGIILDPFMGSGTTGVACMNLNRKFIGIEIEPKYFDIACRRIEQAQRQRDLFIHAPVPIDPAEQRCLEFFRESALCP
jgi:DNA modification methylase